MYLIGNDRILFLDKNFVNEKGTTAKFSYGKMQKTDVSYEFTEDCAREVVWPNIVKEDGFYRMYCMVRTSVDKQGLLTDWHAEFHVVAIESKDGINWYKPNYGVVEHNGNKDNNIIDLDVFDNVFVFKDTNKNCPPDQRYKAIYMHFEPETSHCSLKCSFSNDGISFKDGYTICEDGTFDTLNTLHYDEKLGQYTIYFRFFHNTDGSDFKGFKDILNAENKATRDVRVIHSKDFKVWTKSKRINTGDAPDYQLYTNNIEKYYRADRYYLGFPYRYNWVVDWNKNYDYLCGKERRLDRMKLHPRIGLSVCDHMFIHSTDGENFTISDNAFIYPGPENEYSWQYGGDKLCYGMIETENKLDKVKEISMYMPSIPWGDHPTTVYRYTIRLDGFAYYSANLNVKKVVSKEFSFTGEKLYFNMATSSVGYVQVTIKDLEGNKITSGKVFGDSSEKEIWFDKGCLKDFANKPVTMEIKLKECCIYSLIFR